MAVGRAILRLKATNRTTGVFMAEDKHVRAFRETKIEDGEQVVASATGYIGKMMGKGKDAQHNGALIVTGYRVVLPEGHLRGDLRDSASSQSHLG